MSTFKDLVDRVIESLSTFTADQGEQTYLINAISDSDLTMTVDEPKLLSQGIIEIDDEQFWAKKVDNLTSVVTISPFGRGYRSSDPAAHSVGARIINSPPFPRVSVKQAIQRVIDTIYPDLYVIKTLEFDYVAARVTYEMPAYVDQIHSVSWESIGPSKMWVPINRWKFNGLANTTSFPTGKTLDIYQCPVPGRPVQVAYISAPDNLVNDNDDFPTVTGLSITAEQAVIFGACAQLTSHIGSARLNLNSIEATLRSTVVPAEAPANLSKYYFGLYDLFVQQERERLLRLFPTPSHYRYF